MNKHNVREKLDLIWRIKNACDNGNEQEATILLGEMTRSMIKNNGKIERIPAEMKIALRYIQEKFGSSSVT